MSHTYVLCRTFTYLQGTYTDISLSTEDVRYKNLTKNGYRKTYGKRSSKRELTTTIVSKEPQIIVLKNLTTWGGCV